MVKKLFGFIILISLLIIAFFIGKNFAANKQSSFLASRESEVGLGVMPSTPTTEEVGEQGSSTAGEDLSQTNNSDRLIIKTGTLSTLVKDVRQGVTDIQNLAQEFGGFVVSSSISSDSEPIILQRTKETSGQTTDQKKLRGYITIRVPSEKFDDSLSKIRKMSIKVVSESTTGQDITEQYTDLESRLRNLEASEAQLLKIMERSGTIADVLAVQKELVRTREQVETTKGRMQYLKESVKMSSISVTLATEEAELPIIEEKWQPLKIVKNALRDLVSFWQGLGDKMIYLVVFLSPFVILIILFFLVRRVRRRKSERNEI